MKTIPMLADAINQREEADKAKKAKNLKNEYAKARRRILEEFKIGFKELLPVLKASAVTFSAHYQDDRYPHMGSYVKFKFDDRTLKMDFNNRNSYRYEYVPYGSYERPSYGTMVYAKWDFDRFITWLDENLIRKGK